MKNKFIILLAIAGFLFGVSHFALAANDTSIVIQPAQTEVTAGLGQASARSFEIINRSNFNLSLKIVVKDYRQISEDGKLQFFDSQKEPASSWLIPQFLQISLKPLETKTVGFAVVVPKDFSAGGHYGAILFQPISGSQSPTNNFGELVLLTVAGSGAPANAIAKTIDFKTRGIQEGNPVDFYFKIQNDGNTHYNAQGRLILKNWLGQQIQNYNINQLTVYPNTSRVFQWRWSDTPMIGIFEADVMLPDPSNNQALKMVDSTRFIVFPWRATLVLIIGFVIVFLIVKYRKSIFSKKNLKLRQKKALEIKVRSLEDQLYGFIPEILKKMSLK